MSRCLHLLVALLVVAALLSSHTESQEVDDLKQTIQRGANSLAQGKPQDALNAVEPFIEKARQQKLASELAQLLGLKGTALLQLGKPLDALEPLSEAANLFEQIRRPVERAMVLAGKGQALRALSRYPEARQIAQQLRRLALETKSAEAEGYALLEEARALFYDLRPQGRRERVAEAEQLFVQGLRVWQTMPPAVKLLALQDLTHVQSLLGKRAAAQTTARQALALAQQLKSRLAEAQMTSVLGDVALAQGNLKEAEGHFEEAVKAAQEANVTGLVSLYLSSLAHALLGQGKMDEAKSAAQKAIESAEKSQNLDMVATMTVARGRLMSQLGDVDEAIRLYQKAKKIAEDSGHPDTAALALNNLGVEWDNQGKSEEALRAWTETLTIYKQMDDVMGQASALNNLATFYQRLGLWEEANERLLESFKLVAKRGLPREEATILVNAANVLCHLEQFERAKMLLERAKQRAEEVGDPKLIAAVLYQWGELHMDLRQWDEAEAVYQKVAQSAREGHDAAAEARAINSLALIAWEKGDKSAARRRFAEAAAEAQRLKQPQVLYNVCLNRGHLEWEEAQWSEAERWLKTATETAEMQLVGFHSPLLAESFAEAQGLSASYEFLSDVLARQGRNREALQAAERIRAQALSDLVAGAKVAVTAGLSEEELRRERELEGRLFSLRQRQVRLTQMDFLQREEVAHVQEETSAARQQLEEFERQVFVRHTDLARRRGALPAFSLEQFQKALPEDVAAVEFLYTSRSIIAFVVRHHKLAVTRTEFKGTELTATLIRLLTRFRTDQARATVRQDLETLHEKLIAPILPHLEGVKTLIIVPHRLLWYCPFAALRAGLGQPSLMESLNLCYVPSLSYVAQLKSDAQITFQFSASPSNSVLLFSNPDFQTDGGEKTAFASLPYTVLEAEGITQLYGRSARVFSGAGATEGVLKKQMPTERGVLHVATHGILEEERPFYSAVVLSLRASAGEGEDGFLEAREVLKLSVPAQLVVLSACQTARGQVRGGEGVLGLTWAFLAAGSKSVVASHWQVADDSTAALMSEFHRHLREGKSKPEALRLAALSVMRQPQWRHPFYWSPFILVGTPF